MTDAAPPDLTAMLNGALPQAIPIAHTMGVRFLDLRPGHVSAEVPFEGNGNHFGVTYAGVIFTVAEVLGGAIGLATFDASTHYPLVRNLTIDFVAPGRSRLHASASLTPEEIDRIRAEATPDAKSNFELTAEVTDEDGTVVARTRGDYQLRPHGR